MAINVLLPAEANTYLTECEACGIAATVQLDVDFIIRENRPNEISGDGAWRPRHCPHCAAALE